MKNFDVFLIFIIVRIASVFLVQTYFVADEYWQSLEVSHKHVFGYGNLTWEWQKGIRSYIHPLIIATFYKFLQLTCLDSANFLIFGPRLLQAILSAYSDLCFYRWSGTRKWAVFSIATSWFWFYTASRTLINSFECSLSTIALSVFPWPGKVAGNTTTFLWLLAVLFVIRPTCAVIWLPLCLYHLSFTKEMIQSLIFFKYLPIGLCIAILSTILDSLFYGKLTLSILNFVKFNVFDNVASFYGEQPWHWYISSGIPAILGIHMLPFIMAATVILKNRHNHPNELILLGTIVFAVTLYSFVPHKEFRFLLPILPIMLYISSRFLSAWSKKASVFSVWLVTAIIFLSNLAPAWYFGLVHQRGTLDVMDTLRDIATENPKNASFLFLMPCHSTPMYSHLHINVTTRYLTCLPNFNNDPSYVDEADYFYQSPSRWLRQNYPPDSVLPTHIISFDTLIPLLSDILSRYKVKESFFHCSLPVSAKIGRSVVIHEKVF